MFKRMRVELGFPQSLASFRAYCREIGPFSPSKACRDLNEEAREHFLSLAHAKNVAWQSAATSVLRGLPPLAKADALVFAGPAPETVQRFLVRPSRDFLEALVTNTSSLLIGSVIPCWMDEMVEISLLAIVHTLLLQDPQAACMAYLFFCMRNLYSAKLAHLRAPLYFLEPYGSGSQFLAMWRSSSLAAGGRKETSRSEFGTSMSAEEAANRMEMIALLGGIDVDGVGAADSLGRRQRPQKPQKALESVKP